MVRSVVRLVGCPVFDLVGELVGDLVGGLVSGPVRGLVDGPVCCPVGAVGGPSLSGNGPVVVRSVVRSSVIRSAIRSVVWSVVRYVGWSMLHVLLHTMACQLQMLGASVLFRVRAHFAHEMWSALLPGAAYRGPRRSTRQLFQIFV